MVGLDRISVRMEVIHYLTDSDLRLSYCVYYLFIDRPPSYNLCCQGLFSPEHARGHLHHFAAVTQPVIAATDHKAAVASVGQLC